MARHPLVGFPERDARPVTPDPVAPTATRRRSEIMVIENPSVGPEAAFSVYADPDWLLHLSGELDMASVSILTDALGGPLSRGGTIGLDVADLTFMDSMGIHALVDAVELLGERGHLVLFHPSPSIRRLIEICGLLGTIGIDNERGSPRSSGDVSG